MLVLKLIHTATGVTKVFDEIRFANEAEVIHQLARHENGYDAVFELLPNSYNPKDWVVRFNHVTASLHGSATKEVDDFRPWAEDR